MVSIEKVYEYFIALYFLKNYKSLLGLSRDYNINEIYNYLNEFWFMNFHERLDVSKEENREKIFQFLNDIFRYHLLNDNLEEVYSSLSDEGDNSYVVDHFDLFADACSDVFELTASYENYKEKPLPKMSHEELDFYFRDFLTCVDPSGEFLHIYEDMIKKKRIIYLDELSPEARKALREKFHITDDSYRNFFLPIDEVTAYVFLDREGNIADLRSLAHEFAHYVSYYYQPDQRNGVLQEFPSTFYEMLSIYYLKEKGFRGEDISNSFAERFNYVRSFYRSVSSTNHYLKLMLDSGKPISHELDVQNTEEYTQKLIEKMGINYYRERLKAAPSLADPDKMTRDYCDLTNFYLTRDPAIIGRRYPYIIGLYLASKKMSDFFENPNILDEMKYITTHFADYDTADFFESDNQK